MFRTTFAVSVLATLALGQNMYHRTLQQESEDSSSKRGGKGQKKFDFPDSYDMRCKAGAEADTTLCVCIPEDAVDGAVNPFQCLPGYT